MVLRVSCIREFAVLHDAVERSNKLKYIVNLWGTTQQVQQFLFEEIELVEKYDVFGQVAKIYVCFAVKDTEKELLQSYKGQVHRGFVPKSDEWEESLHDSVVEKVAIRGRNKIPEEAHNNPNLIF